MSRIEEQLDGVRDSIRVLATLLEQDADGVPLFTDIRNRLIHTEDKVNVLLARCDEGENTLKAIARGTRQLWRTRIAAPARGIGTVLRERVRGPGDNADGETVAAAPPLAGGDHSTRPTDPDYTPTIRGKGSHQVSADFPVPHIVSMPNPLLGQHARTILSLLRPREAVGKPMVRKGRDHDGGYVMLDHGLREVPVYSLGIGDDVSWDLDMAALGCEVFQYDHTIAAFPREHPQFHSFHIGIADKPREDGALKTIPDLIAGNGHSARRDLILKIDIEGAEWKVFEALPAAVLGQFSQIVVEMHCLIQLEHRDQLHRFRNVLRKLNETHQVVHVHANNYGAIALVGGVWLPDTFEVTYARRSDHQFVDTRKIYPTELDLPCNHTAADYFLGPMGQL